MKGDRQDGEKNICDHGFNSAALINGSWGICETRRFPTFHSTSGQRLAWRPARASMLSPPQPLLTKYAPQMERHVRGERETCRKAAETAA